MQYTNREIQTDKYNRIRKTMEYTNRIRKTVKYKLTRSTVLEKPWNIQTDKKNHGIYKPYKNKNEIQTDKINHIRKTLEYKPKRSTV